MADNDIEMNPTYIVEYEPLGGNPDRVFVKFSHFKNGKTTLVQATEFCQEACASGTARATVYQATVAQQWIQVVKRVAERLK